MRNLSIFTVFLVSCSTFQAPSQLQREFASEKNSTTSRIEASLTDDLVFANGANQIYLKVSIKDEGNSLASVDPTELKVISDIPMNVSKFVFSQGIFVASLRPAVKSPDIKFYVQWKDKVSRGLELKTTLAPLKDELLPLRNTFSEMSYVSGMNYTRQNKFTAGLYEGFSIYNRGPNRIVNAQDSMRDYEYNFEEHATQNIHLMVSDAPNSTVSHTMHSHFIFFPRKYLPFAEIRSNNDVSVTLPTGEKMLFSESGEIKDGVFKEGPVDIGPDRFKRTYADLKYQGKGILLRANARGQMPQQGQFESTKIDMEYGIKFSADVLIINGTTGQRCRRPKIDFWSNEDVSPIQFKFPTDKEFDVYLKAKCGFGIPELNTELPEEHPEQVAELIHEIWSGCEEVSQAQACIEAQTDQIENPITRGKVLYELNLRLLRAKKIEADQMHTVMNNEIGAIRKELLKDASWVAEFSNDQKFQANCMEKSHSLVKATLRFHDIQALIKNSLLLNCSTLKEEMIKLAESEASPLRAQLERDFSWLGLANKEQILSDCRKKATSLLTSEFRYQQAPDIYASAFKTICEQVESSQAFNQWLKTQSSGLEERIFGQVMAQIETSAEERAKLCLRDYPVDSQLNRMRFKRQRESCLVDHWDSIEQFAIAQAKKDPLVQRVGLNFEGLSSRIFMERRRLQLKIIKKYFLSA